MKKIVPSPSSAKDANGIYLKEDVTLEKAPQVKVSDLSIDTELGRGLLAIHRLMKKINEDIVADTYDKDTVTCLKYCMDMLSDLKKAEDALLDEMSTEELEQKASE